MFSHRILKFQISFSLVRKPVKFQQYEFHSFYRICSCFSWLLFTPLSLTFCGFIMMILDVDFCWVNIFQIYYFVLLLDILCFIISGVNLYFGKFSAFIFANFVYWSFSSLLKLQLEMEMKETCLFHSEHFGHEIYGVFFPTPTSSLILCKYQLCPII